MCHTWKGSGGSRVGWPRDDDGEHFLDALVTDDEAEQDRIVAHIVNDFHEARATDRVTGEVVHADGSGET
ncbi:hypothetical protein [Pseudonocardia zijingensis]|uniref:Uncharacterized protein n=1 Tax=Pseudonocardia zijingensis TaxID=153376 RepID=A0ABN1PXI5_9PSEU